MILQSDMAKNVTILFQFTKIVEADFLHVLKIFTYFTNLKLYLKITKNI